MIGVFLVSPWSLVAAQAGPPPSEGERTFSEQLLDATDLNSSDLVLRVCISRVCQSRIAFLGPPKPGKALSVRRHTYI